MNRKKKASTHVCAFCDIACYGTCEEWSKMQTIVDDLTETLQEEFYSETIPKETKKNPPSKKRVSTKCLKCRKDRKVCVSSVHGAKQCDRCMSFKNKKNRICQYDVNL